jgi:phage terminase small subunit
MKQRKDNPLNPQRKKFKENYLNPNSETFGNAYKSAIAAGYSESYSEAILSESTGNEWVQEIIRDYEMTTKAEKNLLEFLNLDSSDPAQLKVKADITKFITERLRKDKYSQKIQNDHTSGDKPIPILTNAIPSNNSNTEDSKPQQED